MKTSNLVVSVIDVAESGQNTQNESAKSVARRMALQRAKQRKQARNDFVPFIVGDVSRNYCSNLFGEREYSLQELIAIAHRSSSEKLGSVAA